MNSSLDIFTPDFRFTSEELLPEEKLIAAIITQALIDSEKKIPSYPKDSRRHGAWLQEIEVIYESRRWLYSKECEHYLNLINFPVSLFHKHLEEHHSWSSNYSTVH